MNAKATGARPARRVGNVIKGLCSAAVTVAALLVAAPSADAAVAYALTDQNRLLRFDTATPGVLTGVAPISGRVGNEDLIGIDFRPANNGLYAVGESGRLYTIDPNTAAAANVGSLSVPLEGSRFGFDFNPQDDRLRITSDTRQNLRVDATTGATVVDTPITYQGGGNPLIVGLAYTNNFAGAQTTTLYGIDSGAAGHQLVQFQGSPNSGVVAPVGPLGVSNSSLVGFDIITNDGNQAWAALQREDRGVSELYSINLNTGAATLVGTIGGGDLIDGFTLVIPEPGTLSLLAVGALALVRRRR